MRHLQPDAQQVLRTYLPYLMQELGLERWTIDVRPAAARDGATAHIDVTYATWYAELHIAADWSDYTAEAQRNTLVHELLHILHHPLTSYVDELLDAHGSAPMREVIRTQVEAMVDRLAGIIAPTLELPTAGFREGLEGWLGTRFTVDEVIDSVP
ncbi:hypothetical protein [Euzebya rosea]|uniref:hypothetical protein n=1 Tax=Euzebya rosea TaxID=2052804 RepID=UPI000D3EBDBF|nr:hypothetical protein [Euzebya rosea]